jgi:arylsulfatase A-like enzyme
MGFHQEKMAKSLHVVCFIVLFGFGCAALAQQAPPPKPNIIFILADDLGFGDLGSYGQKLIMTPNLDRLAGEGMRFTQAYASAPVCAPSRASVITGLHQGHAYIRGNTDKNGGRVSFRPQDTTLAQVLKKAGYYTGIIGKWGLGEPDTSGIPNKKGFDYFFGYLNQNLAHNYYPEYLWRNEQKVELVGKKYSADLFAQDALDFIRRESAGPFFLYLAVTLPHANNELNRKRGNGMEIPSDAPYTDQDWTRPNKNFAAMVTKLDGEVGEILALLKELHIEDNTIVIFSGDNGPQGKDEGGYDAKFFNSTGGLRGLKRELYEGGIREPMIVRWPNKIEAGKVSDFVWSQYDLFPTFAAIANVKPAGHVDGISILPVWLGKPGRYRKFLYWEFHEGGFVQAVRMGNWKAVKKQATGKIELYDLQKDVKETLDVSAANPKIVSEIKKIMEREHIASPIWPDSSR